MNDQLKTMVDKLQQITGKHKEINSYIGFRKCQTKLKDGKGMVQNIQKRPKEGIRVKCDESVLPFFRNLYSLVNVESVHSMSNTTDSVHVYIAQSQSHYSVKIKTDRRNCLIAGISEMPSGEVVIADCNNQRVKLLNQKYKVIDHRGLPGCPLNLCYIAGNEVAVAVDDKSALHEVHFLTVTKGQLQAVRKFTTDHPCSSVAHHQGQIYVGSGTALYLYTMDGHLKNKMYEDKSVDRTVYECAVSPEGERFYVTNYSKHKLVTLDKDGQVLSTLEDPELQRPSGLCVSPSGHVFVCGHVSNTMLQVDWEGRQKLATVARAVDGLLWPQSVRLSEHTSSLIVGNFNSDSILVVKLC
ncbi:uncharacterized protein LOC128223886 [Mya arenaria]|uniref:uncharacterized protein LOC128223886 n=1 Tax=Mya arenaria TaxID=6604 RepID=UPI0022E70BA5|nr:uncharacterized protein LOC128223886 [Mya arenaria]